MANQPICLRPGIRTYMKENQAKIQAAEIVGKALEEARKVLISSGAAIDEDAADEIINEIIEADTP